MTINTVMDSLGLPIKRKLLALGAARLGFVLMALAFFQIAANAQTAAEQQCFDLIQDKVAFDLKGNNSWNPSNIRDLCRGTVTPQATVDCFKGQIAAGVTWKPATEACRSKATGAQTLEQQCRSLIQGKVAYDKAGNKTWDESNIADLCKGTTNPQATVDCFAARIAIGAFWWDARDSCKAKPAASPAVTPAPTPDPRFPDNYNSGALGQGRRFFSILNYNVMMLSVITFPNHKQVQRAVMIPPAIAAEGSWDVIVVNEAFENLATPVLREAFRNAGYTHQTAVVNEGGITLEDGGVFIVSKLPIVTYDSKVFTDCKGSDCNSNKGVMYALVRKGDTLFHIFGTHLQSDRGEAQQAVRTKQLTEIKDFIKSKAGDAKSNKGIILISGDLNIDPTLDGGEYKLALTTVDAVNSLSETNKLPKGYTFDPVNNSLAKYRYAAEKQEWLDYILVSNAGLIPSSVKFEIMKFKSPKGYNIPAAGPPLITAIFDTGTFHRDLSDHFGLSAEFVY